MTGFSSLRPTVISPQPKNVSYRPLRMRIQIPVLNTEAELVTIPFTENSWPVEWLGNHAGVLEGSEVPGKGISIVAAHNTLNNMEYGPFALLSTLAVNDTIFINAPDGSMQLFRVYANELIAPDGIAQLMSIASDADNVLFLVTCEDERPEGGYAGRRVVAAKPL